MRVAGGVDPVRRLVKRDGVGRAGAFGRALLPRVAEAIAVPGETPGGGGGLGFLDALEDPAGVVRAGRAREDVSEVHGDRAWPSVRGALYGCQFISGPLDFASGAFHSQLSTD